MSSGDVLAVFHPDGYEPPASSFAQRGERNARPVLTFDAAAGESAVWTTLLSNYAAGGLSVDHYYGMASATTGTCQWDGAFERMVVEALDLDTDSFAAPQVLSDTVAANNAHLKKASIAFTDAQIDGLLDGEMFRYKLTRNSGDSATGAAQLHLVVVLET